MKSRILLCIALLLSLVDGCKGGGQWRGDEGVADQTLLFANGPEPQSLDPARIADNNSGYLALNLFEGLTVFHANGTSVLPGCAKSWEVSEDGKTYRFTLRENILWSNGRKVTAFDFKDSWIRVLDPSTGSPYAYLLHSIKGAKGFNEGRVKDGKEVSISAPDEKTLVVELVKPCPYFLFLTSFYTLLPVPLDEVKRHGSDWTRPENIVCNGPFILTGWIPNRSITMKRNERYYDRENVKLTEVTAFPRENLETTYRMYEAGELDWTGYGGLTVPEERIPRLEKRDDFRREEILTIYYYYINTRRAPLNRAGVRRALSLAINRHDIVKYILKGGQHPSSSIVPTSLPGYTSPSVPLFDPEGARLLLAQEGFPDGKGFPQIEISFNSGKTHRKIAEAVQGMWKEHLGIGSTLRMEEWKTYINRLKGGDFVVARGGWTGDYPDPNTFLDVWLGGGGNNFTGWSKAEYDTLIEKASLILAPEERFKVLAGAEALLLTEQPVIPIYTSTSQFLIKGYVKGVQNNPLALPLLKYIFIEQDR